jgi:4'-phosphopantetheinyl transferase
VPTAPITPTSRSSGWTPGPPSPRLAQDSVEVWRCDLGAVGDELLELLSAAERLRARRFPRERGGLLWARSRAVLRALLGASLACDAASVDFVLGAHGKPALASAGAPFFNVSHSGETAVYAFSATEAVGVDVELDRPGLRELALARRAFGAAEAARLQALGPSSRRRELLRMWVRHEAALKCLGTGLGGEIPSAATPWVSELDLGSGEVAAVAVAAAPRALRRHVWPLGGS